LFFVVALAVAGRLLGAKPDAHALRKQTTNVLRKETTISVALDAVLQIHRIVVRQTVAADDAAVNADVDRILDRKPRSAAELERIAVLCYFLAYPRNAGDSWSDDYYEAAFWSCVRRLGRMKTRDSREGLATLDHETHPQTGDRLLFDYLAYGKPY
jgi:hypothetical protein